MNANLLSPASRKMQASAAPVLSLQSFGVAFGERVVIADVTLDLAPTGLTSLVGPAGSGKSTLLRTIAGLNDAHPSLSTWGTALLNAELICQTPKPRGGAGEIRRGVGLVMQHARFFLDSVRQNLVSALPNRSQLDPANQAKKARLLLNSFGLAELAADIEIDVASLSAPLQRQLAIVCAVVSDPLLLMADEPTAGLDDRASAEILKLLQGQATHRAVLFVTHNQAFARAAGGTAVLMAGGRVQESGPAHEFFSAPRTPVGKIFVRTGGCGVPSPDARPEEVDSSALPLPEMPRAAAARGHYDGPRGFFWVWPGRLGGLPRPGIVSPLENDIAGLERLGIQTLVTLEETQTVDPDLLTRLNIASIHFPVQDMGVPELEQAKDLCGRVDELLREGHGVAFHCRAGLGRTGTLLASHLIWAGESARQAIEIVRRVKPQCIQSQMQAKFLSSFELYLQKQAIPVRPASLLSVQEDC